MGITGMDWETGIEGIAIDEESSLEWKGSLEAGKSRMKITGANCEGSLETAEEVEKNIKDTGEFIENINGLYDLQPEPYYYYIDLKSGDKPLFKVNILINKETFSRLKQDSNLSKLLNKDFVPFHENILYGYGSVKSLSESVVEVLDTDGKYKTLNSSSSGERHAYLGESIGDYLETEIGNVVVDKSSVYLDEKNQEYRLEIAYEFDRINMKLLRHSLDGTLYELD